MWRVLAVTAEREYFSKNKKKNQHPKPATSQRSVVQKYIDQSYFYLVHQCLWIRKLAFLFGLVSFLEDAAKSAFAACTPGTSFGMCKISTDVSRHRLESCSHSNLITYFLVSLTWTVCSPVIQPDICWGNSLFGFHSSSPQSYHKWNHRITSCCIKIFLWKKRKFCIFPLILLKESSLSVERRGKTVTENREETWTWILLGLSRFMLFILPALRKILGRGTTS